MLADKMIFHMNNGEKIVLDGTKEKIKIEYHEEQGRRITYIFVEDALKYMFPKDNVCFMEM